MHWCCPSVLELCADNLRVSAAFGSFMIGGGGTLPHFYRRQWRDFVVGGSGVGGVKSTQTAKNP